MYLHLDSEMPRPTAAEVDPTSAITCRTSGQISRAGVAPPDSARRSGGAILSKKACAICDRPALWLQTNSTYFTLAPPIRSIDTNLWIGQRALVKWP